MGTTHSGHRLHKKETFWRHHIECWNQTTLTQAHYCRENGLAESDFSKWKKKLAPTINSKKIKRVGKKDGLSGNHLNTRRKFANRCGFCGAAAKKANKLFYGTNEYIAICDHCLWHKAHRLQFDAKGYSKAKFEVCNVCFESKDGTFIGSVYYKICPECLVNSWVNLYIEKPEKHPCYHKCISCEKKDPKHYVNFGIHVICDSCFFKAIKLIPGAELKTDCCSFCDEKRSSGNVQFGSGNLWICKSCAAKATEKIESFQSKQ